MPRTKPLVLFVGDYYGAGMPERGPSAWEGSLWASLESTGMVDVARFHYDKYFLEKKVTGDQFLLKWFEDNKPDLIVCVYHLAPHHPVYGNWKVPSFQTLYKLKVDGYPIIFIWGDLEIHEQRIMAKTLEPFSSKMVGVANKEFTEGLNYTYLHSPLDPRIFNNPNKQRDIDVAFIGSVNKNRPERVSAIKHLKDNKINVLSSENGEHLTIQEYVDRYQRAKMALCFANAVDYHHKGESVNLVTGRSFETKLCGTLSLEQESVELRKLYTPGVDYVEWTTEVDLLEKIRYYLAHEEERSLIALNGQRKTEQLYSAKTFWDKLLNSN